MKNRKIVNVLDLELTCWQDGRVPAGQKSEIIEIGLCSLDLRTLEIINAVSLPVWPISSSISSYCTELTGWTEAKLKRQGMPFAEACRRLSAKHGSRSRLVVTDSSGELCKVQQQCQDMGVDYPFGMDTLNVSALFTMCTQSTQALSLKEMLGWFGMEFVGAEHSGQDDACNIARLYIKLLQLCRQAMPAKVC